ncbi:Stk1 family PASTA domain-containing Ser/Thr kinase [Candidatus Poriferisocius sp.]|uniref:Stk1 family PASTA domain-containing Ser/Thr kinase n=1 Tax=Candidatus Poriferisocius sp. TaxID=3101276 RepID=UPI003B02D9E7
MSDNGPELLGSRYQLRSQIARGGMTDVFLGQDTLLSRPVAIKRLFAEFATDPSFVERFKREATAAANLSHPNIVAVYDWGSAEGTYYIVMEYIEGHSLAELLRSGGPLAPERAAGIAMYVAEALGFAHSNGVIHRDVKPGNVLLSPDGQVKVTDFGIAIVAFGGAESNLTQTGAVMGTATYFSPEQAQGKPLDHRSDLYSLGIVLYEMLCGRPPFSGDTSLTVAYKHVQQAVPSPSSLGVVLPESLEAIAMKLLAKSPAERYPTAKDLKRDLQRYREGRHQLSAGRQPADVQPPTPPPPDKMPPEPDPPQQAAPPPASSGPAQTPPALPPAPVTVLEPSSRAGLYAAATVIFVAVAVLVFFVLTNVLGDGDEAAPPAVTGTSVPVISVPDVVGLSSQAAIRELRSAGFVVSQVFEASEAVDSNEVISQSPEARAEVEQGEEIEITVSSGAVPVTVPGVVGQGADDAARLLQDRGFASELRVEPGSTAPAGQVLRQEPLAGSEVAPGSSVVLYVAEGTQPVEVPDVTGMTLLRATQVLVQAGLQVSEDVSEQPSAEVDKGLVIGTDPSPPALLLPDSPIMILVSLGSENVVVPSLAGLTPETAAEQLADLELVLAEPIAECDFPNDAEELVGRVMGQMPLAEEEHPLGTEVTVCLGQPTSPGPGPTPTSTIDEFNPRRIEARIAAAAITARAVDAGRQPDALGSIPRWNALSSRFAAECRELVSAYSDVPGLVVEWNLENPYPMPAVAANAANWEEGLDGDTPGEDDGCTVP